MTTGEGIAPEVLPHIFEAFRQGDSSTTRKRGGLGLGLAIAHQLVSMHGGSITASSDGPGRGATFTVALPVARPDGAGRRPAATRLQSAARVRASDQSLSAVRVLIVDDDQDTLDLVTIVLSVRRSRGTRGAHAAMKRCAWCAEWKPDLLLSDITMPDEDGYTVIGRLRALPAERGGATPAAALTAMASDEDRARALAAGFQLHIPKPLEPAASAACSDRPGAAASRAGTCRRGPAVRPADHALAD